MFFSINKINYQNLIFEEMNRTQHQILMMMNDPPQINQQVF